MKRTPFALMLACLAAFSLPAAAETLPPDAAAIAAVKAGTRPVAEAAWWGFDPADATAALQAAIDSGARKVILKDMKTNWVVGRTINLASDQELVLEKGVVLQAKRGAFKDRGDRLFSATDKKNVAITGEGATIRMWRGDYDRPPYTRSEFRHAISICGCSGVKISGLTIAESGGDGIYLGATAKNPVNKDIVIRNVDCDRNYRQGISVISAENLLIENTVLRNTSGTAPMAGIDFEPNKPAEKLANCVMRNCVAENNAGDGFTFYVKNLGAGSAPISVRLENCRATGNRFGFRFSTGEGSSGAGSPGTVDVVNCRFEGSQQAGISLSGNLAHGRQFRFEKCQVVNAAQKFPNTSPIHLSSSVGLTRSVGGAQFADCLVVDALDRLPLGYTDLSGGLKLAQVGGTLTLERSGQRTVYTLDQKQLEAWFPIQAFKEFPPFELAGLRLEPALPGERPERGWACTARQRGHAEFILQAGSGDNVALTLDLGRVGKAGVKKTPVSVITPAGKTLKLAEMTAEGPKAYSFKAAKAGIYRLVCEAGSAAVRVLSSSHRVCIFSEAAPVHFLGATGNLYFSVPAGTGEFAIRLSGAGGGESVKAAVYDAAGRKVAEADNIQAKQILCTRPQGAGAEAWRVRLEKPSRGVIEDHYLCLQGIAPILASSPQALLKSVR